MTEQAAVATLNEELESINQRFGAGTVMKMSDAPQRVPALPTGVMTLDLALGIGGVGKGRIIEIYGPESSGKSTLVLTLIAQAQAAGGTCAYIDAEHAMDPSWAMRAGVDVDALIVSQPDYGEQALEVADRLVKTGELALVAVDSVAALTPKAELEGEMGDQAVGRQARMMSQAMRKISGNADRTGTSVVFVNQIREKIGVMFGSPETQPGGRALKFFSSQRIDVRRIEGIKEGTEQVGSKVRAKVVKNKTAAPFKEALFDIYFDTGLSRAGALLDAAVQLGVIRNTGKTYIYGDEKLSYRKSAVTKLMEFERYREVEQKCREAMDGAPKLEPVTD